MNFLNTFYAYLCNTEPELPGGEGKPPKSAMDTLTSDELGEYAVKAKAAYTSGNNPASWVGDEELWEKIKTGVSKSYNQDDDRYWPTVVKAYQDAGGTVLKNAWYGDSEGHAEAARMGHMGHGERLSQAHASIDKKINDKVRELESRHGMAIREEGGITPEGMMLVHKLRYTPSGIDEPSPEGKDYFTKPGINLADARKNYRSDWNKEVVPLQQQQDEIYRKAEDLDRATRVYKPGTIVESRSGEWHVKNVHGGTLVSENAFGEKLKSEDEARQMAYHWKEHIAEPSTVPLIRKNESHAPGGTPAKTLANESLDLTELECAFDNEVQEDKDGFVQLASFGDKENVTPDGLRVIQRFGKSHALMLKNEFDSTQKDEAEAFSGIPIYKGHPDRDGTIPRGNAGRKIGRTMQLQVRDDGLYGTRLMNSRGTNLVKSGAARYPSVNWFAKATGVEGQKLVMEPVQLISWGLTPKPNLPVKPLVNSAIVEKFLKNANSDTNPGGTPATNTKGARMDKAKLIALLATVGVTLANDASEDAIEKAMQDAFGKVKTAEEISIALANAKTDAENKAKDLKTATDKVTELTANLANAQTEITAGNEAKTKLATSEKEVADLKGTLQVAETTLANSREERSKTASDAAKIATDLTEANTKLGLTTTTLTNERKEHEKTTGALKNAKAAIIDLSVAFGKIRPHQRKDLEAALANDVEFAGVCDKLKKADPVFKMVPILTNESLKSQNAEPAEQYRVLVNETMKKDNISYEKATIKVKSSEKGKALLALMKQPETGIPVVR